MHWKDAPHLDKKGLFIVGHARSGTTVLLRALNSHPDIYLLGEATLFQEGLKEGFSQRYNLMHQSFENPRSKSSYCPFTPNASDNGVQTIDWLGKHHRFIGEKLAFRSTRLGYDTKGFFDFHATHFPNATYVCIFRHPLAVLSSNLKMFTPERADIYAESYIHVLLLITEMYATFRNVLVLSHEDICAETFSVIGGRLGLDLIDSFSFYEELHAKGSAEIPYRAEVFEAHELMKSHFSSKTLLVKPRPDFDLMQKRLMRLQEFVRRWLT